jgi:predicted secreted Zn-dependent protease
MTAVTHFPTTVDLYEVSTGGVASQAAVFAASFHQDTHTAPLCNALAAKNTAVVGGGCAQATAATGWVLRVTPDVPYNPSTGAKVDVRVEVTTDMTLPTWVEHADAPPLEQLDWWRSTLNTVRHEAGHRATGQELGRAVARFLNALPATVPVATVLSVNTAAAAVIDTLQHLARTADRQVDATTDHGFYEGAIYDERPEPRATSVVFDASEAESDSDSESTPRPVRRQ